MASYEKLSALSYSDAINLVQQYRAFYSTDIAVKKTSDPGVCLDEVCFVLKYVILDHIAGDGIVIKWAKDKNVFLQWVIIEASEAGRMDVVKKACEAMDDLSLSWQDSKFVYGQAYKYTYKFVTETFYEKQCEYAKKAEAFKTKPEKQKTQGATATAKGAPAATVKKQSPVLKEGKGKNEKK